MPTLVAGGQKQPVVVLQGDRLVAPILPLQGGKKHLLQPSAKIASGTIAWA
ncbi:MAG TPA: hypothetical protein VEZ50_03830 [Nodosilinea sp.]|nr:hypothetical protein [Nodosilinea sp.]